MARSRMQTGGGIATLVGVALFVVAVVTLHMLPPGYQPREQLISELALGHSVMPSGTAQRVAAACLLPWLGMVGWKLLRGASLRPPAEAKLG